MKHAGFASVVGAVIGLIADRKLAVETQQQIKRARQVNLPGPLL
ncbi:MAG: hypothetical protein UC390_11425 [Peptococcaceae bacterium]|nr:hypothetical protein [Peptococcaceae bacterium]